MKTAATTLSKNNLEEIAQRPFYGQMTSHPMDHNRDNNVDKIDIAKLIHDIKGPLNSMKGLLKIAKMDVNSEIGKHYLDLIEKCQEQLDSRINESLTSFKNGNSVRNDKIDFKKLIDDIKEALGNIDGFSQTEFNIQIKNKIPVHSDHDALYSILQNIVENAIKYRKTDINANTINIIVVDTDEGVHIKIADNGKGIKSDLIPTIFDINVKDDENQDENSHGIGLAIVKKLVERLSGTLTLDTKHGVGTTFNIHLPCQKRRAINLSTSLTKNK